MNIISKKLSITKSNALINASYRLSLNEMRVVMYGLSLINPIDEQFPTAYEIDVDRFCSYFNIDARERGFYKEIKESVLRKFWERDISFWDESLQRVVTERWLTRIEYNDKKNEIKIYFNPFLEKQLQQLKENFTSYFLANVSGMKSVYGVRIYELCIMEYNRKNSNNKQQYIEFKISITELKKRLMLEDKYTVFKDFKIRVVEKAKKEINTHSDIKINYKVIKKGRSPYEIEFWVIKKDKTNKRKKQNDSKEIQIQSLKDKIDELKSFLNSSLIDKHKQEVKHQTEEELKRIKKELFTILKKGSDYTSRGMKLRNVDKVLQFKG